MNRTLICTLMSKLICLVLGCRSFILIYLFWNRMMGINDVKKQMIVWSIPTTIAWAISGSLVIIANLIWGNDGSVIDLIFPLGILALIMGYVQVQNKTL